MPTKDTNIGWTDDTWNPVHGCFKVSEGCMNCYAARQSTQYGHTPEDWTVQNIEANATIQDHHLSYPLEKEPRRIFVNSMSDIFLPKEHLTDEYLHQIFDVIEEADQHVFQALTKHGTETGTHHGETPRLLEWDEEYGRWPDNLWMGVSVENGNREYRYEMLKETGAATKWVSFEPLVGHVKYPDLSGIDWAVVGGESGPDGKRREMDYAWAREIRDECERRGIPFFFKQSSAREPESLTQLAEIGRDPNHALLQGGETTEYRQLPELPDTILEAKPELADQVVA